MAGEHDPYLARMKAEGEERDEDSEDGESLDSERSCTSK